MIAVMFSTGPDLGSLGLLLMFATVVPFGLLLAPQPIRRDKRTIIGLLLLVGVVVVPPVYAAICNICEICARCDWWWCPLECWFL